MTAKPYYLGIDIGTTSTKTVAFDRRGTLLAKAEVSYPLLTPVPHAAEQDPQHIWQAVVQTIGQVVGELPEGELLGLGFSAAMHSLIAVDGSGNLLCNSITWADNRSAKWVPTVRERGGHDLYRRTGTPIHPMSPLVKLVWLRHERPDLFVKAAKWISIKEYICWQLFEEYAVDYAIAAATGMLNLETLQWDDLALAIAHLDPRQLSCVVPTTHCFYLGNAAATLGIRGQTPVIIGASDGVLANLGIGAITPGNTAISIGTSGAVRTTLSQGQTDPQERLFCYPLSDRHWVVGGAVNNGGIVLRWVRDNLTPGEVATAKELNRDPYELLTAIAATVAPGAEGLLFHPYLAGERSPLWDANARGSFFGLGLHHRKAHLIRAVLEGIVFNLYLVWQALETVVPTQSIRATGGFARSPLWRQILCDVFNREVIIPNRAEGSAYGAILLARYALGDLLELETPAAENHQDIAHRHQPDPTAAATYQRIIPLYSHLLEHFRGDYEDLARLQDELTDLSPPTA